MGTLKPRYVVIVVAGLVTLVAAAAAWNVEAVLDLLFDRGYKKYAVYDSFLIEEVNGKYYSFTVYVNEPNKPHSALYVNFGGGHVKAIEKVTIDDMKLVRPDVLKKDLELNGNGVCMGNGYEVEFRNGIPTNFTIYFSGALRVGRSAQGPFASHALTKQELIEIFGEPKRNTTSRIGWH